MLCPCYWTCGQRIIRGPRFSVVCPAPDRNPSLPLGGSEKSALWPSSCRVFRRVFAGPQAHRPSTSADSGTNGRPMAKRAAGKRGPAGRRYGQAGSFCTLMYAHQRIFQVRFHLGKRQRNCPIGSPDQHVIPARTAICGQDPRARLRAAAAWPGCAKPLHRVSLNRYIQPECPRRW